MNRGSLKIAKIAGIPVKVHWTFGFLLLFIFYFTYSNHLPSGDAFWFLISVLILFVFVVMHEFGHALTAKRFGVVTRDIIISPIGGVARLENMPQKPEEELKIAVAGPLVNVGLATLFLCIQLLRSDHLLPVSDRINFIADPGNFIAYLLLINIALIVFNMIPAFPMDGGRVLRALLSMWLKDRLKATRIASAIGQILAIGFIGYGFYLEHFVLMFIGLFVFIMARNEFRQIKLEDRMNKTEIGEILRTNFTRIYPSDKMRKVFDLDLEGSFLIFNEKEELVGTLPALFIKNAKRKNGGEEELVANYLSTSFGFLSGGMTIGTAFHALNNFGWSIAAVLDDNKNILGVVDRKLIQNFIKSQY